MLIDRRSTPKRRVYDKKVLKILLSLLLIFFLVPFVVRIIGVRDEDISKAAAKGMVFLFMGLYLTTIGFISYKSRIIGGFPRWFNYWEGTPAKVSAIILMLIGIFFLILTLGTFTHLS